MAAKLETFARNLSIADTLEYGGRYERRFLAASIEQATGASPITVALRNRDLEVRKAVANSLRDASDPLLVSLLREGTLSDRTQAASILETYGEIGSSAYAMGLVDGDQKERDNLAHALEKAGIKRC